MIVTKPLITSDDRSQRETQSHVILIAVKQQFLSWFLKFYSEVYSSAYSIEHSDFTILLDCYIYIYIYNTAK